MPIRLPSAVVTPLAFALALSACAPNSGGVRGYTAFIATARITEIKAQVPLDAFARCFQTQAEFLPLSRFALGPDSFTYRLQARDLWLEEMVVNRTPDGIAGELRVSGIYDKGWRDILERDRLPALAACQTPEGLSEAAQ